MSRPRSHSLFHPWRGFASLIALAVLLAPTPAGAGIGDLVKKAKDKAAQVAGKKAQPEATPVRAGKLEFDDTMIELTEARVARIAAAVQASNTITAGRAALVEKVNKLIEERGALEEKHGDAMRELRSKRGDVEGCLAEGYNEAQNRRSAEYAQKALTDPAIRGKFAEAAAKYNADAARGDTTAQKKLNEILMSEVLPTKEDSAAVRRKCGPVPPPSPAEVKAGSLDKDIAGVEEQIRDMDKKAEGALAKEAGLSESQIAMALERIKMYLDWRRNNDPGVSGGGSGSGSGSSSGSGDGSGSSSGSGGSGGAKMSSTVHGGFTQEEIEALEKHLEKFRAARLG